MLSLIQSTTHCARDAWIKELGGCKRYVLVAESWEHNNHKIVTVRTFHAFEKQKADNCSCSQPS